MVSHTPTIHLPLLHPLLLLWLAAASALFLRILRSDACCGVGSTTGRDHLPVSHSVSTWAGSNMVQPIRERDQRMDQPYDVLSALGGGHPTFTHFLPTSEVTWFRRFAQEFNWNSMRRSLSITT
ncbi:hypothetical protein Bca52824_059880 [Brassica carinata]|uniref:Secreted protein n=1 Tax=Brassica carinata TaxID=52824 RepID=A0A8X7QVB5_BRACI|nr:hypothetical protein Bca52824_059880 [Brassica carinata]